MAKYSVQRVKSCMIDLNFTGICKFTLASLALTVNRARKGIMKNKTAHMDSKLEEISFSCKRCPKTFATEFQLKYRMPIHTGQWNILCEMCQKGFSIKSRYEMDQKHEQVENMMQK